MERFRQGAQEFVVPHLVLRGKNARSAVRFSPLSPEEKPKVPVADLEADMLVNLCSRRRWPRKCKLR
jgi:hypothetical protein